MCDFALPQARQKLAAHPGGVLRVAVEVAAERRVFDERETGDRDLFAEAARCRTVPVDFTLNRTSSIAQGFGDVILP